MGDNQGMDDTGKMRIKQAKRKTTEHELEADSVTSDEEDQHRRRGDKAAYLEEKLAERERAERDT